MNNIIIAKNTGRDDFIENVKKWVHLDRQLKIIHEKTKKIRDMKNDISMEICNYVKENNISNKISITDGELAIYDKKEYSPLTYSYIEKCLAEIVIDKAKIEYILSYLKERRDVKVSKELRRNVIEQAKDL